MSEVYVISKGEGENKRFFEGDGDWAADRIDAHEYETIENAIGPITAWNLDSVGEIKKELALPKMALRA